MDAYEAIMTRRSTRNYKPDTVEPEKLDRIINAGRFAPSGGNSQSNHFFVITDKAALGRLAQLAQTAFAKMEIKEDTYASLKVSITKSKEGGYSFCYNAPVLVVVANQADYGNNIADSVAAVENMMVEANELDLGSCYINQLKWLNEDPEVVAYMRELGMRDNERVYASAIFGYPQTDDGLPVRQPLPRKGNEVTYI
ncbi:MAG: nitroreductase [Oscillibacter sp.]|nr:nitroreductase [Oscillibacter sp.]